MQLLVCHNIPVNSPQLTGIVPLLLLGQLNVPDHLLLRFNLALLGGLLGQAALVHRAVRNADSEEGPPAEL